MMMHKFIICLFALGLFSCQSEQKTKTNSQKSDSITGIVEIDEITKQIFENNKDPKLYHQRAQEYIKKGMYDNAEYDLKKAIKMDSLTAEYHHLLSDVYMDNVKSKDALMTMENASKLFPNRIPTLLKLAETQLILKQYENSVLSASKVLSINPNEAEGYFMLGMNFRAAKETEKAINSFQTAVEMNPDLIDAWLILGELYEEKEDPLAEQYYNGAVTAQPDNLSALHSKAFYLQNHGKMDEAIEIYKKMISIDKFYAPSFLNMGILYLEKDSVDIAYEQFNVLARISPTDFRGHFYLGLCNELKGDYDAARENLRSAQNLNQEDQRITKAIQRVSQKQSVE